MGPKRFVLSVDDDSKFRSRCEWVRKLLHTNAENLMDLGLV
jgi:hypothetical protein